MTYTVKEIFYSLQGEGRHAGRAAVFCRFAGCNLWSGREADRAQAICRFCDTAFVGTDPDGGKFSQPQELANRIAAHWPGGGGGKPYVICTGGEPLLQLDCALIEALHRLGFEVAVETNGTLAAPAGLDWICVSPKAGTQLLQTRGDELKLVYPQQGIDPTQFEALDFNYFLLQPLDDVNAASHLQQSIDYCLKHPRWRLSIQTHKIGGIR